MLPSRILLLGFLFVSFRPSSLRSHSCSTSACLPLSPSAFPLPIRFLSSASLPVPTTQSSVLPFRDPRFRLSVASPVPDFALASSLSTVRPAWFPMRSFRLPVLGFLFVSFRSSLIRSHSRSSGAYLMLSLSVFSASRLRPFGRRPSASSYSAFLFFLSALPGAASQLLSRCRHLRFRFPGLPLTFRPVSRASRPLSVLGFSAGFLSSFPVPLPQPLSWCLPSSGSLCPLLFGLFPSDSLPFVRSSSVLTTQLSALSFPFFPISPSSGSFGASVLLSLPGFPLPSRLFPCAPSGSGTQFSVLPFSHSRFASQMATSFATACLSV